MKYCFCFLIIILSSIKKTWILNHVVIYANLLMLKHANTTSGVTVYGSNPMVQKIYKLRSQVVWSLSLKHRTIILKSYKQHTHGSHSTTWAVDQEKKPWFEQKLFINVSFPLNHVLCLVYKQQITFIGLINNIFD